MNTIIAIFRKELTDVLRDRRTLFFMIVMHVIVMHLILIGALKFQQYQSKKSEEKILNIAIINETSDTQIRDYLLEQKGVELIENINLDSLELGIKNDSLQGGLHIGKNFLNDISSNAMGKVAVYYKSSDLMSKAKNRINNALESYKKKVVSERLSRFNIDKALLEPLDIVTKDMSTKKETMGKALGGLVPYMLVIFIFLGAMYPAIDLGAGEKERGSLETLLSSPATKFEITVGKLMVVSLAGMVSGLISVVGISSPLYFIDSIPDQIKTTVLEIINPFMIISVITLMIPIAIFFASMLLSISFYTRSFKEAQSLMGPLNIIIIVPLMLTLGPGIEIDHITALIPLINVGLLTKEILAGSMEPVFFVETLFSLLFFAAIGIRFSVYWFNKESTIFRV